jgi:1,4-alpha-glucan branching enzyme
LFSESSAAATLHCYSAMRNLHHAKFFCDAPKAHQVALVGDFNNWDPTATPMHRMPDGCWMASLELPHGHHQYLFLVDGRPVLDPKASGIAHNNRNELVSLMAIS